MEKYISYITYLEFEMLGNYLIKILPFIILHL